MKKVFFVPIREETNPKTFPKRETASAAGIDLYAIGNVHIPPNERAIICTGWSVILPPQTYGRISDVSSLAFATGAHVIAGVIDNDYEGEIKVLINNSTDRDVVILKDTKIAQLVVTPYDDSQPVIMSKRARAELTFLSPRQKAGFGFSNTDNIPSLADETCHQRSSEEQLKKEGQARH